MGTKWVAVAFGALSAILWGISACISIPTGFDADQAPAFRKVGRLNAAAATSAAISTALQAFA